MKVGDVCVTPVGFPQEFLASLYGAVTFFRCDDNSMRSGGVDVAFLEDRMSGWTSPALTLVAVGDSATVVELL
jgi:hypothetical protein